jgi:plasmid stabilization system protein ParE
MRIDWTRKAQNKFVDILDYIEQKFGETARNAFKISVGGGDLYFGYLDI